MAVCVPKDNRAGCFRGGICFLGAGIALIAVGSVFTVLGEGNLHYLGMAIPGLAPTLLGIWMMTRKINNDVDKPEVPAVQREHSSTEYDPKNPSVNERRYQSTNVDKTFVFSPETQKLIKFTKKVQENEKMKAEVKKTAKTAADNQTLPDNVENKIEAAVDKQIDAIQTEKKQQETEACEPRKSVRNRSGTIELRITTQDMKYWGKTDDRNATKLLNDPNRGHTGGNGIAFEKTPEHITDIRDWQSFKNKSTFRRLLDNCETLKPKSHQSNDKSVYIPMHEVYQELRQSIERSN